MKERQPLSSLEELDEAIQRFDEKESVGRPREPASSGNTTTGMRMGLELVCGVAVGLGMGVYLDKWLGTSPIMLLICLFFGTLGGFMTLLRTVRSLSGEGENETTNAGE